MCPYRVFLGDMEGLQYLGKVIILIFIVQWLHVILYNEKEMTNTELWQKVVQGIKCSILIMLINTPFKLQNML